jgi:hypothetical protein
MEGTKEEEKNEQVLFWKECNLFAIRFFIFFFYEQETNSVPQDLQYSHILRTNHLR